MVRSTILLTVWEGGWGSCPVVFKGNEELQTKLYDLVLVQQEKKRRKWWQIVDDVCEPCTSPGFLCPT
jgi:hypothetical protein